jgi:hypothetical protein
LTGVLFTYIKECDNINIEVNFYLQVSLKVDITICLSCPLSTIEALRKKIKLLQYIQGVSEISALILTGNRTHQKEQLFSLPFCRKTLRNGLKK